MIDYVLLPTHLRPQLTRARSYGGTQLASDHKLVIADLETSRLFRAYNAKSTESMEKPLAVAELANPEKSLKYRENLKLKLQSSLMLCSVADSIPVADFRKSATNRMRESAKEVVGHMRRSNRGTLINKSAEIQELSREQSRLRVLIDSGPSNAAELRKARNQVLHKIRNTQLSEANDRLDKIAEQIDNAPESVKMFQAAKALKRKSADSSVKVESTDGEVVAQSQEKTDIIAAHFQQQFYSALISTVERPTPHKLEVPVAIAEVSRAL
ncbi:uncharacterized protein LOC135828065 [Sycon ciliatum]|uniref:uncharacterized protein LOC135828065 n=1 Tax=Sycon ciliatum TaxID=27933 RepID=UPI0031F605C9